jgi:hypothetical protein
VHVRRRPEHDILRSSRGLGRLVGGMMGLEGPPQLDEAAPTDHVAGVCLGDGGGGGVGVGKRETGRRGGT